MRRAAASLTTVAGLVCMVALAACAPAPVVERPAGEPPLPDREVAGAARYRVTDEGTRVYARVYRGGSMAKLGHNHVVLFPGVRGDVYLADDPAGSQFDLAVPVAGAVVDPPALRRSQGREFRSDISDDARSRTRDNMLGEQILHAAGYPYITVSSAGIEGPWEAPNVTLAITIRDTTRRVTTPVSLAYDGDSLFARARLELHQSDFGIEPFTVLGGALRVRDRVELNLEIAAQRVQ